MASTWDELPESVQQELALAAFQLRQFSYGYERMYEVGGQVGPSAPSLIFYVDTLRQMLVHFFLLTPRPGDQDLRQLLVRHGLEELLEPIDAIFQTVLGETTVGEIMRTYRHKSLVHRQFQVAPLEGSVYARYDLRDPAKYEIYNRHEDDLFLETQKIAIGLKQRFPEAF